MHVAPRSKDPGQRSATSLFLVGAGTFQPLWPWTQLKYLALMLLGFWGCASKFHKCYHAWRRQKEMGVKDSICVTHAKECGVCSHQAQEPGTGGGMSQIYHLKRLQERLPIHRNITPSLHGCQHLCKWLLSRGAFASQVQLSANPKPQ